MLRVITLRNDRSTAFAAAPSAVSSLPACSGYATRSKVALSVKR
jgi:hypothetical protein